MIVESVPPLEDVADLVAVISPHTAVRLPCLDHDASDYQIHPCDKCDKWWAEVVHDSRGRLVVREWHSRPCGVLHQLEWE
jgi:hypothetical protein